MSSAQTSVEAIRKTLVVDCGVERAFDVFTRQIGSWWPLGQYSIGGDTITEVVVEEHVGGRIFERHSDGGEGEWGRVVAWEPPARFAMTWYPGHDDSQATELDVRFTAEGGRTRVELVHSGWEILGARAPESRTGYDAGWGEVLGFYEAAANA
jgi:uncharacterized protein YndB with AHSA1/START domain